MTDTQTECVADEDAAEMTPVEMVEMTPAEMTAHRLALHLELEYASWELAEIKAGRLPLPDRRTHAERIADEQADHMRRMDEGLSPDQIT